MSRPQAPRRRPPMSVSPSRPPRAAAAGRAVQVPSPLAASATGAVPAGEEAAGAPVSGKPLATATPAAVPSLSDETVLAGLIQARQARRTAPARSAGTDDLKTTVA